MNVATHPFNAISLCSGAAGLDIGVRLSIPHARTICWVEWEAYAAALLVRRMEEGALDEAPVWSDLRTFDGKPWRGVVDCVTAGFPCQPFSTAGKRLGADDPRHLWPHVRRILEETGAPFLFCENVEGHVSLGFEQVDGELRGMGYQVAAALVSASDLANSHQRLRLFFLAYSAERGQRIMRSASGCDGLTECDGAAVDDATGARCGDARQWSELRIERLRECVSGAGCQPVANASIGGRGIDQPGPRAQGGVAAGRSGEDVAITARNDGNGQYGEGGSWLGVCKAGDAVADTSPVGPQGERCERTSCGTRLSDWSSGANLPIYPPGPGDIDGWRRVLEIDSTIEPAICRMADGLAETVDRHRRPRLRLCGNGVFPTAAALAFAACVAQLDGVEA